MWMLKWDADYLYLALDVTDDSFTVGEPSPRRHTYCWKTGLQIGFEVGGPAASTPGALQAERSTSLEVSRLDRINLGFFPGQTSCRTQPNISAATLTSQYEQVALASHPGTHPCLSARPPANLSPLVSTLRRLPIAGVHCVCSRARALVRRSPLSPLAHCIFSLHPLSASSLCILSLLHPLSASSLCILSLHPLTASSHCILSLHPLRARARSRSHATVTAASSM